MKKTFEQPQIGIERFPVEDVITTSGTGEPITYGLGRDELPPQ